jgi:hypothetical protein
MKRLVFLFLFALMSFVFASCSGGGGGGGGGGGLTDAAAPVISVQPSGGIYNQYDTSAILSVTAGVTDGGSLSYRWYRNTVNSASGGNLVASTATYTVPTDTTGTFYYYVVVTNTNTGVDGLHTATATSNVAVVTVSGGGITNAQTPVISAQPQSNAYLPGASVILSITAGVSDGGTLSYQWFSNTSNSAGGGNLVAATPTYTVPTGSTGTFYYYAVVTNTNNAATGSHTATATSSVAVITISSITNAQTPNISAQPSGGTYSQFGAASLSVTAGVTDGGILSYQWFSNTAPVNTGGTSISSATTNTYAADTSAAGTFYYYVVVTNTNTAVSGTQTARVTSSAVTVTVNGTVINAQTPGISVQPQSASYFQNTPVSLSVTAGVTDGGVLSYKWFSNTSDSNIGGTEVSSEATYAVPTDNTGTFYYYAVITNTNTIATGSQTATATSNVAVITVSVEYTARFYSNGTLTTDNGTLTNNIPPRQRVTLPTPTAIPGYEFYGWFINNTGSVRYTSGSYYTLTADTDFYAKWNSTVSTNQKVKAVVYDDGIKVDSIEEFPINYINLQPRTRKGYTFNGWKMEGNTVTANPIYQISVNTNFTSDFTLNEPIVSIDNATQLAAITDLSGHYMLTDDIDLSGYSSGIGWNPIGNANTPFKGVFEGNGKKISGLTINDNTNEYVGLFGYLKDGARIANLTVELADAGITGKTNAGGIAGYVADNGSSNAVKIVNSHTKKSGIGEIHVSSSFTSSTYNSVGGIVGHASRYTTIIGCSNEVAINSSNYAGGIVGAGDSSDNSIYNSWNIGDITASGNDSANKFAGGIEGDGGTSITGSHNTGTVMAKGNGDARAGGIKGQGANITNSYNTGDVKADAGYRAYAGGIVGSGSGNRNYNDGKVSAFSSGNLVLAGGIVGYGSMVSESYNTGTVSAANNSPVFTNLYAGGIVGFGYMVSGSYNIGDITASSTGTYVNVNAAGIMGHMEGSGTITNNAAANSSVTGIITGTGTTTVNRILADTNGGDITIRDNFALDEMGPDRSAFGNAIYKGTDKTEAELKTLSTYSADTSENGLGWKFGNDDENPWKMPVPDGSGYPLLYWQTD